MKLTRWFPGNIKPVHTGVYQTRISVAGGVLWAMWGGKHWGPFECSQREVEVLDVAPSSAWKQEKIWRGLVK